MSKLSDILRPFLTILALSSAFAASAQTVRYIHTDGLGSVVAVTDVNRNVVERRDYDPYGAAIGSMREGPAFTGHVADVATGVTYMQQRYYDPEIGRFLSVDPIVAKASDISTFNRYVYAKNSPYRFTDPDGRDAADRAYGAAVGWMLRNDPERLRIWAGGEAAATTEGRQAEEGAALGLAMGRFFDTGDYSKEAVTTAAATVAIAIVFRGRGMTVGGGATLAGLKRGEIVRIQNAANRSGTTITLVGSRASGKAKAGSDWDYVIEGGNSKTRNNVSRSLPGAGSIKEGTRSNVDLFRGKVDKTKPYIEFKPEKKE